MRAEHYLRKIDRKNRRIDAMLTTADRYLKKARRDGVMDDKTVQCFIDMAADLQRESVDLRAEVERMRMIIKLIDDEDIKLFIELRYFHGLKMESISNSMRCSVTSAYRLQRQTIAQVQRILDDGLVSADG